MKNSFAAIALVATLGACNDSQIETFPASLQARRDFALKPSDNAPAQPLAGGRSYSSTVTVKSGKLLLAVGNETFVFGGAKFDANANRLMVAARGSRQAFNGDALGIDGSRKLVGSSNRSYRDVRSCTYFEQRPIQRCAPTADGRQRCWTEMQQFPVSGHQTVDVKETTSAYSFNASILGASGANYAGISGRANETTEQTSAVSACQ